MSIILLSLELVDYINNRLKCDDLQVREVNNLKLLKSILCDFVISDVQKRKEHIYVTNGEESCSYNDINNCK